ncbi:MAG: hypothetical protein ABSC92_18780 [Rhizomicrobium sp.]|jgi:hypothetical protein
MTKVLTRIRQISHREGFDVWKIKHKRNPGSGGGLVRVSNHGVLGKYPFPKAMKGSMTVDRFIKERFERTYPGFTCRVLKADGTEAKGQTKLETVRRTYKP